MGSVWSNARTQPVVLSVDMGQGGEEEFEEAIEMRVEFERDGSEREGDYAWRVTYEVDVADLREQHVLVEIEAKPLALDRTHVIRVPCSCLRRLRREISVDRLCNVSALTVSLLEGSLDGREILRLPAVVEVYQTDARAKVQHGGLRRRIYAPVAPFGLI